MATYRTLISVKDFLKVQKRAGILSSANMTAIKYYDKELVFSVPSASGNGFYDTRIVVKDLDRRKINRMSPDEVNKIIRNSNLLVNCTCPAYKYWGFKYIATVNGYAINVEQRSPSVRNKELRGYVCKHIYKALQTYPFLTNTIREALTHG